MCRGGKRREGRKLLILDETGERATWKRRLSLSTTKEEKGEGNAFAAREEKEISSFARRSKKRADREKVVNGKE